MTAPKDRVVVLPIRKDCEQQVRAILLNNNFDQFAVQSSESGELDFVVSAKSEVEVIVVAGKIPREAFAKVGLPPKPSVKSKEEWEAEK